MRRRRREPEAVDPARPVPETAAHRNPLEQGRGEVVIALRSERPAPTLIGDVTWRSRA
jgi:hypothetical protein